MNQDIRNKLRNVVTQSRKLLEDAISQELEGKYGIFARKDQVTADPNAAMSHLSDEDQASRRDILDHFAHIKARGFKPKETLDQLVREIAFTHLNRLCAYKMMEAREVYVGGQKFRDAVSRGVNSNGVKFYLADHEEDERLFNTGHQDLAYRHFLDWLGGTLSEEIGVLFNPNDPANRLYPRQKTLDEVLDLLNGGGIKAEETELREQWPQIWSQDETIGWVYQYFTPKELRDQARKESQAPRNSYELAFRNQFFTPRYVVEFLTDNTLGRIWYEMRQGDTRLKDQCRYMVRRPTEIFLKDGEQQPASLPSPSGKGAGGEGERDDLSQEEFLKLPVYIPHRPKKDPRELKILDPACGSGHFLLYCFDLLLTIYEEAYTDPDLGPALQKDYPTLDDLKWAMPALIMRHNVHGIDIDLRATQIAALALWLRCQRHFQQLTTSKEQRTKHQEQTRITRSNFVCAEPMPGEETMLKEFVGQLEPKVLGQVVEVVFEKMKLAGEAGSLLKIEEEIRDAVAEANKQWVRETTQATDRKGQPLLFTQGELDQLDQKPEQPSLFDFTDLTDAQFFENAETRVIEALRSYAEKAQNGQKLQKRLFTEDAVRGFSFVDLCQKRYDVVLMNPPFGDASACSRTYICKNYPQTKNDLIATFVERGLGLLRNTGRICAITSRTCWFLSSFTRFRQDVVMKMGTPLLLSDLGIDVLDTAMVETAAFIVGKERLDDRFLCFKQLADFEKDRSLRECITQVQCGVLTERVFYIAPSVFLSLPGSPFAYWAPGSLLTLGFKHHAFEPHVGMVRVGVQTDNDSRFVRLWWEVPRSTLVQSEHKDYWAPFLKGDGSSPFLFEHLMVLKWTNAGSELKEATAAAPGGRINNECDFFKPGISWAVRTSRFSPHVVPRGCIPSVSRYLALPTSLDGLALIALWNSKVVDEYCKLRMERHGHPKFIVGVVKDVPTPRVDSRTESRLRDLAYVAWQALRDLNSISETSRMFCIPAAALNPSKTVSENCHEWLRLVQSKNAVIAESRSAIDALAGQVYGVDVANLSTPPLTMPSLNEDGLSEDANDENGQQPESVEYQSLVGDMVSYCIGVAFGVYDVRYAVGEEQPAVCSDPFAEYQQYSPGMLKSSGYLSSGSLPEAERVRISSEGIVVDDPESPSDSIRRVREVLEVVWPDRTDSVENEVCDILFVKELRDYFRKAGKGGFWEHHISRYSKSRRKAPIYWLLQSSKKNYALWLYYHRLDKDLLFKALVNYVEPKIRLETSRLETLRNQKAAAGESGKEAKRLAKETEWQEDFLSELRDFEDKLRRAANLHLDPDLNDGVVLNIAPLHELVPWKEAKKYWDELLEGKYEWSSIGKQLREKGLVK